MAERRALLRQRLAGLVGNSKRLVTGQSDRPAGDVTLAAPLVQQHFWCLDQLAPGQGIVNVNRAWRIDGAFDPERCRSALSKLTHKYDSLRYGLRLEGDSLQITVKDQQAVDFDQIDLRQSPEALDGKLEAESLLPFDVEAEPLLRLRAYHLAEQAWVLHLVYHHAIMDGWSLGQFCQELGTVYAAPDQQVTRPTYDFAAYAGDLGSNAAPGFARRAALRLTQRPKDRRQKPVDMPDLLLPYDFARPPVARFQGESSVIEIKSGSRALVEQLAGRLHVSPIAVLLAVLRVTLFRITGQRDFCIGNTAMNRNAPGLQKMLGAFVETLPIHTPLVPEMGFDLLCQAEQQALAKALEQDETGEEAGPETGEAAQGQPPRAPRDGHEVVLNYRGFSTRDLSLPGCQVQPLPLSGRSTPFTLALNLENTDAGYRGELVWNKARFCAETADRMVAEFTAVLAAALDSPGTELAALPPQSSATEPVLQTAAPKACPPVVTQLLQSFADHADQDAVSQGDQRWSYRDLDQASAAWAATIAQAPGDPGDLVALALPRGPEFVAALIAILRSGRAFLPLSPADPAERLKRILNSANPRHLIAAPELADSLDLQALERPGQGTVEGPMQGSDAPIGTDAVFVAEPEDLAYVMFTSGSTGAPKGVEIPHRALSHHLAGVSEVFEAKSGDRLLSLSSTTFDSIIFEVLLPLVTGGSLVMVEEARRKDPWHIVAQLRSVQPDLVFATPSMWRMLLEAEPPLLPRLTAVTGGELLSRDLANRILPQVGRLVNGYGPTEATVFSSWCDVRSEEGAEGGCSQIGAPIGLPFPGYKVAVLDADYQAVWPGRLGEIWISGAGLARGYYQAPERSAEVFVDMDAKPGPLTGRWYRSGDLGRLLPGG
ncbi:AMP-binding protein, partial [Pseudophaeobacter sp.]|uniref:AMP-binding protein n=1 Tax=Pseudophaeobacter sp. TaxID=1971739 RepID=UPI003298D146